jgi:hypothetical protein
MYGRLPFRFKTAEWISHIMFIISCGYSCGWLERLTAVGSSVILFRIWEPIDCAAKTALLLRRQATTIETILADVSKTGAVLGQCEEIIRLEREAGRL